MVLLLFFGGGVLFSLGGIMPHCVCFACSMPCKKKHPHTRTVLDLPLEAQELHARGEAGGEGGALLGDEEVEPPAEVVELGGVVRPERCV